MNHHNNSIQLKKTKINNEITIEEVTILFNKINWNDNWKYIQWIANIKLSETQMLRLGEVRIINTKFCKLDDNNSEFNQFKEFDVNNNLDIYTLGNQEYYNNINKYLKDGTLTKNFKIKYFKILNDIAYNELYEEKELNLLTKNVSERYFYTTLGRLAKEKEVLTDYNLEIKYDENIINLSTNAMLKIPNSLHCFIGKNGIGKTRLLNYIAKNFKNEEKFCSDYEFSKCLFISFSPFDKFDASNLENVNNIGYDQIAKCDDEELKKNSFIEIGKKIIWNEIIEKLKLNIDRELSSGQKIYMLMIKKILENIEPSTLLLIDELELFLHPPMIKSLISEINIILKDYNCIGIIATHSPIVLQEIINKNVYILKEGKKIEKPSINTYGESIDNLTWKVFGLEWIDSGFYNYVENLINIQDVKTEVKLLGNEAKSIYEIKESINKDENNN